MKIGVLSPTTWQLVEKMAALFPEGVEVVGPLADGGHYWNDYRRKMREWEDLGLHVTLRLSPYDQIQFSDYDVLIESVETFSYSRDWLDQCHRLECPVLLKACWTRDPLEVLPAPTSYFKRRKSFPVLLEMPAHARNWEAAGFRDVNVLPNPVGDWWFARPWSGEQERVLFVLSGAKAWRGDPSWFGLDMWEEIKRAFPGRAHHLRPPHRDEDARQLRLFAHPGGHQHRRGLAGEAHLAARRALPGGADLLHVRPH